MKKLLTLLAITFFILDANAKHVDVTAAESIAKNFLTTRQASVKLRNAAGELTLAYTSTSAGVILPAVQPLTAYFYVFNIGANQGFVIISADDNVKPVLAYSDEKSFDPGHIARSAAKWLDNYKGQIRYVIDYNVAQTSDIKKEWDDLTAGTTPRSTRALNAVNPLVQTTWDQPAPYNNSCPYDAARGTNCVTGCPATAMAQILKYYAFPAQGAGIHTYNDANYGTLTANFGSTTYSWASMPNSISSANADIDNLMFQCGVAVEMSYGVDESSGYVITADNAVCCQNAYTTYFGYNANTIQGLKRSDYSDQDWISALENELTNSRVVQYAGFGSAGGHTWVCDGFDANNMFHMNWGWSGADDAYYTIDALNPSTLGTGGGNGGFNSGEEALIGIEPIAGGGGGGGGSGGTATIGLYAATTVSPNPLSFAQAFTVTTNVVNNGSSAFSGSYCAALFNSSGTFISYIGQVLTTGSNALPAGDYYINGLTFTDTLGQLLAVPGTYTIGIFYAPTGDNWYLAGASTYVNPVSVTITGPTNGIELNSNIVSSPGQFVQGQAASVNLNLVNNTTGTFVGSYGVALYDLAGNYVQTIGTYSETAGLQGGYTYNSPYLTFSTSSITASPGTYILGVLEEETGTSNYYLVGGSTFTNPVNITVVGAPLAPDVYEADNTIATAYNFPLTFSGNNATVSTAGSNIHSATDLDYYKIVLPAGYYYTFYTKMYNASYEGPGQSYTLDGVASYSTDGGSTWSSTFNGEVSTFTVQGGVTLYFLASPYFPGETGTYLLEANVTRSTTGVQGIETVSSEQVFGLYPNPANGMVTITGDGKAMDLTLYDVTGKEVLSRQLTEATNNVDISSMNKGMYVVKVQREGKSSCQKLVID